MHPSNGISTSHENQNSLLDLIILAQVRRKLFKAVNSSHQLIAVRRLIEANLATLLLDLDYALVEQNLLTILARVSITV